MSKILSTTYYQENNERLQKKLAKDIKIFLMKKKKKSSDIVVNISKISHKMKNKSLSIQKTQNKKKCLIVKSNDLKSYFEDINLLQKAYLNKNFRSVYKNRQKKIINLLQKVDSDEKSQKLYIKKLQKKN